MATKSIEERAAAFADSKISGKVGKQCIAIGYIHGAQEQGHIARQEERERCINTIREQMNKLLYPIKDIDLICDHVRKAIEKGGEE